MNRAGVLVVGGGIGGLAAALAGARAGVPVQLFERNPAFAEVGKIIRLAFGRWMSLLALPLQIFQDAEIMLHM